MAPTSTTGPQFSPEEHETRLRTQRAMALVLCAWGVGMSSFYAVVGAPTALIVIIVSISIVGAGFALAIRRLGVILTSQIHTGLLGLALLSVLFVYGGISNHMSTWLVVLPVISLFQGSRTFTRLMFVCVIIGVVVVLGVEEIWGLPEPVIGQVAMRRVSAFSSVLVTTIVLVMATMADRGIRRRNEALGRANATLVAEVGQHRDTQAALRSAQAEVVDAARLAGRAEVATGALHNIGNALNSVTVSTTRTLELVQRQRIKRLDELAGVLDELPDDRYAAYVRKVREEFERAQHTIVEELERVHGGVQHVARVVDLQQEVARHRGLSEAVDLVETVRAAALLVGLPPSLPLSVHGSVGTVVVDRHRVLQILANLLKNAREASATRIDVRLRRDEDEAIVTVSDDGMGIDPERLTTIFAHGFTTKPSGSGFGLHASAIAAGEMGGSLDAASDGPGTGATFQLRIPVGGSVAGPPPPDMGGAPD